MGCLPELPSRCSLVSFNSEAFNVPCAQNESPVARMVCRGNRGLCKERPGECLISRTRAQIHRSASRTMASRVTANPVIRNQRGSLSPRVMARHHHILALRPIRTVEFPRGIQEHRRTHMLAQRLSSILGRHRTLMVVTASLAQPHSHIVAMVNLGQLLSHMGDMVSLGLPRNRTTVSLAQPRSHSTASRRSTHNRPRRRIRGAD